MGIPCAKHMLTALAACADRVRDSRHVQPCELLLVA